MKKVYMYLFFYALILYSEFIFAMLTFDSFLKTSVINIMVFSFVISCLLTIICSLFKEKVNKIIAIVLFSIIGFWYNLYYIFETIFDSFFSLAVFKLSDQGLKFANNGIIAIITHFYGVILLFIPLILIILLRKKLNFKKFNLKQTLISLALLIVSILLLILNVNMQKQEKSSIYDLYFNINDNNLNIEKLGVINATVIDIDRTIRGFNEKIIINTNEKEEEETSKDDEIFAYDYNQLNLDFNELLNKANTNDLKTITNYISNKQPTKQNKYTSIFKDKNLIYITAESFSEIAVSEKLTPTLYKLINQGFHFTNYYSSNNLSTIGGEFQSLTGLYADNTILSKWRQGKNAFPYGLSNIFKNAGYNTFAYHNHYYDFQDRDKYLKAVGFDNYLGCYNGLEKRINCKLWPESDVELIESTIDDYISSDKPFLAYYMTVSGHFAYNFSNKMAKKNYDAVKDLPYSDPVKAYIATQIELDKALEILLKKLEENNKLDDTVIVLLCDHYPYGLTLDEINEVSTYERDSVVEINHNNLIIFNNKLKYQEIDKVAMSVDVIPTVYNLFGLEYDSRLYAGNDIFSDEEGVAFFKNRSWVTEKGTYLSNKNKMINQKEDVTNEYIERINSEVANRMNISKLIIKSNYYDFINKK